MPSCPEANAKPIECKAMVARAPKAPMVCETVTVDPPKAGEVRVKVMGKYERPSCFVGVGL